MGPAEWEATPAVDHHCHPLRRWPPSLTALDLRAVFTEALDPRIVGEHTPCTAAYRSALRRLGEELGCAPTEEAILQTRDREDPAVYGNRLLGRSGTAMMLLDHGFAADDVFTVDEHRAQVSIPQREIVRLESLAEEVLAGCAGPGEWFEAVREGLRSAVGKGAVAVKTIAAYRAGLGLRPQSEEAVAAELSRLREGARRSGERPRLGGEALCHSLLFEAAAECRALGVPLQVHCGLGDPDEDLALASPLGLRRLLADPAFAGLEVALLHCYPYHREAAYLCAVYPDVYMDLSLAIPLAAADGARAMREALGLCPWSKLLYATDASRLPEAYFVAATLHREALGAALSELVGLGALSRDEAAEAGRAVLAGNAVSLYRLPAP